MKVLLSFLFLVNLSVSAKTLVISDIDDTLKRTNVLGYFTGGLRSTNPFIGLPELFNDFLCNEEETQAKRDYCKKFRGHNHSLNRSLIYVTAASGRLQMFGREFISRSGFPQVAVIGKETGRDTLEYKVSVVSEIVKASNYDEIILIGDNGEHDVGAYKAVSEAFPNKKITTYIHQVYNPSHKDGDEKKGVDLAPGQVAYFTGSDLALEFYAKGLISEKQLKNIVSKVHRYINSRDEDLYEQVVPEWSDCRPFMANYERPSVHLSKDIEKLVSSIEDKLKKACR
ncbi:phosphatase domain-containing protein [Halobacteriovorax marinus]|uniref:phosphatase domain-containing protein n=1 Tax=Halobacteriovorax marinus TaxID=97084 RepID=UPI003A9349F4